MFIKKLFIFVAKIKITKSQMMLLILYRPISKKSMKHLLLFLLFSLLLVSFLGDAGLITIPSKAKIELSDDMDAENEGQEEGEKQQYAVFHVYMMAEHIIEKSVSKPLPKPPLFFISYEIEVRPPRA